MCVEVGAATVPFTYTRLPPRCVGLYVALLRNGRWASSGRPDGVTSPLQTGRDSGRDMRQVRPGLGKGRCKDDRPARASGHVCHEVGDICPVG